MKTEKSKINTPITIKLSKKAQFFFRPKTLSESVDEWIDEINERKRISLILDVKQKIDELHKGKNTNNKNESTPKPQRIINTEELGTYFKPIFKGMGNGNINFFNFFIEELKTNRSAKEFAQIALMCWEGKQMGNKKPKTFSKWYGIFCECVHCEKKTYKPNQLMPVPKNIISLFPYLQ